VQVHTCVPECRRGRTSWRKILFQQASSRQAAYALSPERDVAFLLFPGYAIDPTQGKGEIAGQWDVGGPLEGPHVCKRE
jgi:hypothetical protein